MHHKSNVRFFTRIRTGTRLYLAVPTSCTAHRLHLACTAHRFCLLGGASRVHGVARRRDTVTCDGESSHQPQSTSSRRRLFLPSLLPLSLRGLGSPSRLRSLLCSRLCSLPRSLRRGGLSLTERPRVWWRSRLSLRPRLRAERCGSLPLAPLPRRGGLSLTERARVRGW